VELKRLPLRLLVVALKLPNPLNPLILNGEAALKLFIPIPCKPPMLIPIPIPIPIPMPNAGLRPPSPIPPIPNPIAPVPPIPPIIPNNDGMGGLTARTFALVLPATGRAATAARVAPTGMLPRFMDPTGTATATARLLEPPLGVDMLNPPIVLPNLLVPPND